MSKDKEDKKIMSSKMVTSLIAGGLVLIVFSQLFEVRVLPSKEAKILSDAWKALSGTEESQTASELTYADLAEQVIPVEGRTVLVEWGDMGKKLVEAGAIDLNKFEERYEGFSEEQREVLLGDDLHQITFTSENIQFWTNVLWSLGLTQRSKVLSSGPMQINSGETPIENYASTAGWTLGAKEAMQLYNSRDLIELTKEQDELVYRVAENIFRPCCGNSTAYPDCNHGMAVLGLLELMVSQGASEEEMYKAALVFNSYAFDSTYISTAAYYSQQGTSWADVDAKTVLDQGFSGAQGAAFIAKAVGEIPGAPERGASCGA